VSYYLEPVEVIVISDSEESVIQDVEWSTNKSSNDLSTDSFSDTDAKEESVILAKHCPLNNLE